MKTSTIIFNNNNNNFHKNPLSIETIYKIYKKIRMALMIINKYYKIRMPNIKI
jgi:hypothetical protein